MTNRRVLFLPCFLDGLPTTSASVRFRAQWPAKYWSGADCYDGTQRLADYDVFVFQKFYLSREAGAWARALKAQGKMLVFDMCDADWIQSETHQRRLLDILPLFDFAVAPTQPIRDWLARWLPAYVIPDRLDLDFHTARHKVREGQERPAPSLIWFGYSGNLVALDAMWPELKPVLDTHDLPLTILADALPDEWRDRSWGLGHTPTWLRWTLERANEIIAGHDVALNPRLNEGRFAYKSENKTITAWALGVPVARTVEELLGLLDDEYRAEEAEKRLLEVEEKWDVRISVEEWQGLIEKHMTRRR